MVERWDMVQKYSNGEAWSDIVKKPQGEFVHYTDYAALEAERDEWKRRCEKIVTSLKPDGPPVHGGMFDKEVRVLWRAGINLHTAALAIADGRDNG